MALNAEAKLLWDKIRNKNCTECKLHEQAQTVCLIGDGPVPAKIMIVGEAPGFREDEISRPFSGKSGRLLEETLEKVGLNRKMAFITNANKCRPPENRTPNKTEQKACRHYLDDEVEAVKPEFILTLGNGGLSLVKKSGIMKHRGTLFQYGDAQVFPTVHPAAVLRNPRFAQMFESDLAVFARLVRGEAPTPSPKTILVTDTTILAKMCKAILLSKAVAYDIETNGFDEFAPDAAIATISVSPKPGVSFVVPIHHPETPFKHPERVLKTIANALAYTGAKRIAHNAKFDDRWIIHHTGSPVYADFDTMVASHVLDENRFKSLKFLGQLMLGVDPWGIDVSDGKAMTEPLRKVALYNAKDTAYTLALYETFKKQLKDPGEIRSLRLFVKLMMPASRALTDIERIGLWVDQKRFAQRRIKVTKRLAKINKELTKLVGYEANWNSTQQLAEIMFERMNVPIQDLTKGGNPSTNESVMLRLKDEYPIAAKILEWREWHGFESRYFKSWEEHMDHNGRMHANYKLTGTVTGRLSSGKETGDKRRGLNAQQIPRDPFIRGIIGAPPGYKFVEADFAQIELRLAAHASQDPVMMRIFLNDEDPHMVMAMKLTGKPAKHVTKEERKKSKGVNFGYLYGMGWAHFVDYVRDSYGINVTDDEAKQSRKDFFDMYRKLPAWHDRQKRVARNYGRVSSAIGRVRHLPDIYSEDKDVRAEAERQAVNSPIQSLASDMMLMSMAILHSIMPPKEARIVGSVHDSLLFEIRDDVVDKWTRTIKQTMENLPLKRLFDIELTVPIKVDVKVGEHWSEGEEI